MPVSVSVVALLATVMAKHTRLGVLGDLDVDVDVIGPVVVVGERGTGHAHAATGCQPFQRPAEVVQSSLIVQSCLLRVMG